MIADKMLARRKTLLTVVGNNRNTWMSSYYWASWHVAVAVRDGKISEQEVENFALYHPEDCIAIAQRAGIYPGELAGIKYYADHEDVSLAIDAIRGLRDVRFQPDTNPWHFHYDAGTIEEVAVTWEELEVARIENVRSYRQAAEFIVNADAWHASRVVRSQS